MKMLLLVLLSGLTSFAETPKAVASLEGENAQKIYEALAIQEIHVNPGSLGSVIYEKSVGGLVCRAFQAIHPAAKPTFKCVLKK